MNNTIQNTKDAVNRNVSMPVVVSTAVGIGLFGLVTFLAVKSGIKPLKDVANIAKGGK